MKKIKGIQVVKPEELRIIEMDMPQIDEENNVLVKVKASGICGSDIGIYHGTNAAATYPRVIGHEIVGEVVETGPSAKKVKIGDRVLVHAGCIIQKMNKTQAQELEELFFEIEG